VHAAVGIAKWYGAEIGVLHVVQNAPGVDLLPIELTPAEREGLVAQMRRFVGDLPGEVRATYVIREAADVSAEIVAQAGATNASLLVVGSHGRSGFQRFLLGSVTEKVMRRASCPVLVVPLGAPEAEGPGPLHTGRPRILCPVDYSGASLKALEYAMDLAQETDAQLTVIHVIEMPPELREHIRPSDEIDIDRIHASAEAAHLQHLRALIPDAVRSYCTVEALVREGGAYREVLKLAAERSVDLIVMGVQGRNPIDRLVFGSNTQHVVRAAHCPVMIVHDEPGRAEEPR
jgi:nucleotide-binding universal stress UspA family protein